MSARSQAVTNYNQQCGQAPEATARPVFPIEEPNSLKLRLIGLMLELGRGQSCPEPVATPCALIATYTRPQPALGLLAAPNPKRPKLN